MYEPRPVRLQITVSLLVFPSGKVRSPRAPALTTKIGLSGPRPLATTSTSSAKIGVGAVIFELRPRRHSSLPVRGSYPRIKFDAFAISSSPFEVVATVGVPHDGISSRSVFQTVSPVLALSARMNESVWVSHCTITRSFQMMGELAEPHSKVGMS